jgi:gliding motility-associated-like protein
MCESDMMFRLIIFLVVMYWNLTTVKAQNLVPNPSFENYKKLPCKVNEFSIQDVLENWVRPIPASSDYWRTDIGITCDLNPNRLSRQTRTGSAMTGIIAATIFKDFKAESKEYLEVKLNQALTQNKLYCGEFYTFNRNTPNALGPSDILESNNLSMAFSDTLVFYPVSTNPPDNLTYPSWIRITEPKVIRTDNQWHRIEGCFVADKNYQYLLIGNFQSVNKTQVIRKTFGNDFAFAYHFIDDVSLMELPYNPPALADQLTFCHSENSITLDATSDGATGYTWQDGSTGSKFVVTKKQTGSYSVTISYGDFTYKHTYRVEYVPDIDLGPDTLLCRGETITLKVNHPIKEYFWFDQSSDSIKVISSEGSYWVDVVSQCVVRDTIEIKYIDCPGFVPNVFTPNGDEHNQTFVIENIENRDWGLQIFNRWGAKVYEDKEYKNNWDGSNLSAGVYYYLLHSVSLNKKINGWVHVIK